MRTDDNHVAERRHNERRALGGTVTVRLPAQELVGPGENASPEGVYFVTEGKLDVDVVLPGETEPRRGELVRVTQMGDGRLGIAVRLPDRA